MAYGDERNAGFRITAITGLKTILGKIAITIEKMIEREPLAADANNTPVSRPVDSIDARLTVQSLDTAAGFDHTASAANVTAAFTEAAGASGSVVIGTMVGCGTRHIMRRRMGGFNVESDAELEGSALTYTPTA